MAAAYAYAVGKGPPPDEWVLMNYIDRFGAEAVMGRRPSANEMRRMVLAENVITSYRDSKQASSLADWIKHNHDRFRLLKDAEELWQMQP
jgi:hypothetical protein